MIKIAWGYNRFVLLFGNYVIKFPNIFNGERAFVVGQNAIIREYELSLQAQNNNDHRLGYVYCRGWFGLFLIMKRYTHILNRELTNIEVQMLPIANPDLKIGNYAVENNQIVVIDYGHSDCWYTG